MKTCKKCNETKPVEEFYHSSGNADGLDRWCKTCRKADTYSRGTDGRKLPWSTEQALKMLMRQGIPATVGYVLGRPSRDIVAYGYITIEAKSALPAHGGRHSANGYTFGMTLAQRQEHCDYYALICKDTGRVFVVPGNNEIIQASNTAIYINVTDEQILKYENGWEQIKRHVLGDIHKSRPIQTTSIFAGGQYRQVTAE